MLGFIMRCPLSLWEYDIAVHHHATSNLILETVIMWGSPCKGWYYLLVKCSK